MKGYTGFRVRGNDMGGKRLEALLTTFSCMDDGFRLHTLSWPKVSTQIEF